jgi:hypothetical protein
LRFEKQKLAYINRQVISDIKAKAHAMLNAAFKSVAGYNDDNNTPKTYKDLLKHR